MYSTLKENGTHAYNNIFYKNVRLYSDKVFSLLLFSFYFLICNKRNDDSITKVWFQKLNFFYIWIFAFLFHSIFIFFSTFSRTLFVSYFQWFTFLSNTNAFYSISTFFFSFRINKNEWKKFLLCIRNEDRQMHFFPEF